MNGIERPLSMAQKFFRNSLTSISFISLLIVGLVASAALIADVAKAQEEIPENNATATISSPENSVPTEGTELENEPVPVTADNLPSVGLTERQQERIINLAANISNRLDATMFRLVQIETRLATRIAQFTTEGYDTGVANIYRDQALENIQTARDTLASIDNEVMTAVTSADVVTAWRDVRATYELAANEIRAAHLALTNSTEELITAMDAESQPTEVPAEMSDETPDQVDANLQ